MHNRQVSRRRLVLVVAAVGAGLALPAQVDRFEFVPGVRLSARAENDAERFPLIVDGPGRLDGRLVFGESDDEAAPVRGRLGGRRVRATLRIRSRVFDLPDEGDDGGGGGGGDLRTALAPRAGRG